jgi:hypothetical protein
MIKKLKWYLTTRKCDVCLQRKPMKQINFFSMHTHEQVCEDCIDA